MADVTTEDVWNVIESRIFAVIGMVTARHQARTAGIVYQVRDRRLYFGTAATEWKTRHIGENPDVSVTVPIAKSIPFLPFVKIPAATVTFAGVARILEPHEIPDGLPEALDDGLRNDPTETAPPAFIEIVPTGDFVTYGVGVSLNTMRDTVRARGRAPVGVTVGG
ncbi:MAG: pyridoxamine 5'-phosphate oxidase family protein [Actinomycetota bacterium]